MNKPATTNHKILDHIANRWSPRAFDTKEVTKDDMNSLFEAARWAASSMNEQPWKFIYAFKGESSHDKIVETLVEGNKSWAREAPVLILTMVHKFLARNGRPNNAAQHDLGLAIGNLSIQASSMGIGLHQMGGFSIEKAQALFEIDDQYDIISTIAVGYPGDPELLDEPLKSRELAQRTRKPISEIAFHGNLTNQ